MKDAPQKHQRPLLRQLFALAPLWLLILPIGSAAANCSWLGQTASWNHYYDGQLSNGETVRAVLAFHDCKIAGTWFDSISLQDLTVSGDMSQDGSATLRLSDPRARVIATARGRFFTKNFSLLHGELQKSPDVEDVLFLLLHGIAGLNGKTAQLRLSRWWDGDDAKLVEATGITNLREFNDETLRFWRAVRGHDVSEVTKCVHYPLSVDIYNAKTPASKHLDIPDAQTLRRDYDEVFDWHRQYQIIMHLPRHLIWGYYGGTIMLGDNVVLFNPTGQVIALPETP